MSMKSEEARAIAVRKIISAAVDLMAEGNCTIKDVSERSGLPKANVHYYFKSKGALEQAALDEAKSDPHTREHMKILCRYHLDRDDLDSAKEALRYGPRRVCNRRGDEVD